MNKQKKNKKINYKKITVYVLLVALIASYLIPVFAQIFSNNYATLEDGHVHNEKEQLTPYYDESYEEIKEKDKIKDEININFVEDWNFTFCANEDFSVQEYYYSWNEYNQIIIERIDEPITKENAESYYNIVLAQYPQKEEYATPEINVPYITNSTFEEKDDNSYYITLEYDVYTEANTEILEENATAVIQDSYITIIKIVTKNNISYMLSYSGYNQYDDVREKLNINEIIDSFNIK